MRCDCLNIFAFGLALLRLALSRWHFASVLQDASRFFVGTPIRAFVAPIRASSPFRPALLHILKEKIL